MDKDRDFSLPQRTEDRGAKIQILDLCRYPVATLKCSLNPGISHVSQGRLGQVGRLVAPVIRVMLGIPL